MKVYFLGIGGIGTSALAQYYLTNGHKVTGSDLVSSEITDDLIKKGAKIEISNSKVKIPHDVDLVIHSPAVNINDYRLKTKNYKLRTLSYPQALGELTKKYFTIAVSGTHGKSTTTAMLSLLLARAGLDPTVIIGTKIKEFGNTNFRSGKSKYLVIEADEHFASFLNYWPRMIVLTNIDRDHLDYYKNLNNILKAFKKYVSNLPEEGHLVINADDENIWKILDSKFNFQISSYELEQPESRKLKKILKVPGEHNIYDALAALTAARVLNIPDKTSFKALSEYNGAWRRFEILKGVLGKKKITIISDYAHNPAKVRAAMRASREKFPKKEIWMIYQPHQHERTLFLFKEFIEVFRKNHLNKIIITDIFDVAGREKKGIRNKVDSRKLVLLIKKKNVIYLENDKVFPFLSKNFSGEVLAVVGAGDIYKLVEKLT
ncbi:MAG: UDP-N-acetylmuramate--L-alanine ligase [Candidatus Pacebacteria bacterium]|nr:UDP-N-acetylmuramate--L-alanine ligase [Candidatus Paceibacterota bacterium]